MPATRRRTSARKSAKTATPVVKESTKTVKKSSVATQKRVNKVTPIEIKKVTETPTPTRVRPEKPNLTWEDYRSDVKVRWEIHVWETQELWKDSKNFYQNYLKPFTIKTVNYLKDSYDRAFNEDSK